MHYPVLLYRGEQFNANFYYFAGIDIDHAFLLLEKEEKILLAPRLNEKLAREKFDGSVIVYEDPVKTLKSVLKGKKISVDNISMRFYEKLNDFCKPSDVSETLALQRAVKNYEEIKKIE